MCECITSIRLRHRTKCSERAADEFSDRQWEWDRQLTHTILLMGPHGAGKSTVMQQVRDQHEISELEVKRGGLGITETHMVCAHYGSQITLCDSRQHNSSLRKWVRCFANVGAIIFVVDISEYDQPLQMSRAFSLFEEIYACRCLRTTTFCLFLNKIDEFKRKVNCEFLLRNELLSFGAVRRFTDVCRMQAIPTALAHVIADLVGRLEPKALGLMECEEQHVMEILGGHGRIRDGLI